MAESAESSESAGESAAETGESSDRAGDSPDGEKFLTHEEMADLFDLLGSTQTLAIVAQFGAGGGPYRFSELESEVEMSPTTLSKRLDALVDADLLSRTSYDEIPPHVEYEATEKGRGLGPVFEQVSAWAEKHES